MTDRAIYFLCTRCGWHSDARPGWGSAVSQCAGCGRSPLTYATGTMDELRSDIAAVDKIVESAVTKDGLADALYAHAKGEWRGRRGPPHG